MIRTSPSMTLFAARERLFVPTQNLVILSVEALSLNDDVKAATMSKI